MRHAPCLAALKLASSTVARLSYSALLPLRYYLLQVILCNTPWESSTWSEAVGISRRLRWQRAVLAVEVVMSSVHSCAAED